MLFISILTQLLNPFSLHCTAIVWMFRFEFHFSYHKRTINQSDAFDISDWPIRYVWYTRLTNQMRAKPVRDSGDGSGNLNLDNILLRSNLYVLILYTLSIITSHILFGLGASLSLVNYARWLAPRSNDVIIEKVYWDTLPVELFRRQFELAVVFPSNNVGHSSSLIHNTSLSSLLAGRYSMDTHRLRVVRPEYVRNNVYSLFYIKYRAL